MIDKYFKQNDGVLVKVIPNYESDNNLILQLTSFIHDIHESKLDAISKLRKNFLNFKKAKSNLLLIMEILSRHPNVISYEIHSNFKHTTFNFWIPRKISKSFINILYNVWDGAKIQIYVDDYLQFDTKKSKFSQVRFSHNSILPLNIGKIDITSNLVSYLDTLEENEQVIIQFLMMPEGNDWRSFSKSSIKRLKKGEDINNGPFVEGLYNSINSAFGSLLGDNPHDEKEFIKDKKVKLEEILSKTSQKGINMNIRIGAQSDSIGRTESLISGVVAILKLLDGDGITYNQFIRKDILTSQSKEKFYYRMKERRLPIVTLNDSNVWVNEELASIIKQPDKSISSNKLERVTIRNTSIPDKLLVDSKLRLGLHHTNGHDQTLYWDMKDIDTVMRPTVVISNPGEGKTQLLANKFIDWINLGYGAAVIDVADGKLIDNILNHIDPKFKDKIIIIDCNDTSNPPALSNFSEVNPNNREAGQLLSQMWTEFYINYFGIDDHHRSKDFIRKSSIPVFTFEENTILEQYLMIADEDFRNEFLEKIQHNKRLFKYIAWWENFNSKPIKVKNEETKAILNKFDVLMDNEILKNIICQRDSKLPKFRQIMDEGSIVLIKAGEGAIYYEASRIIGALVLMKFWMAALSRHELEEHERKPFKVFCDEPQNYITSGNYIKEMLAKSRKYRLGLEFYFQDPNQIEDKNLLKLLVNMNPHLLLGKMGSDAYKKYFKDRILPITPPEGERLPRYHWIVSIFNDKDPVDPFIMKAVNPLPQVDKNDILARKHWIKSIKNKYSRPVEMVEDDIIRRELSGMNANFDDYDGDIASI